MPHQKAVGLVPLVLSVLSVLTSAKRSAIPYRGDFTVTCVRQISLETKNAYHVIPDTPISASYVVYSSLWYIDEFYKTNYRSKI